MLLILLKYLPLIIFWWGLWLTVSQYFQLIPKLLEGHTIDVVFQNIGERSKNKYGWYCSWEKIKLYNLGFLSLLNQIRILTFLQLKPPFKKFEPRFVPWKFFLLNLRFIFINILSKLPRDKVVISLIVLLSSTWIYLNTPEACI